MPGMCNFEVYGNFKSHEQCNVTRNNSAMFYKCTSNCKWLPCSLHHWLRSFSWSVPLQYRNPNCLFCVFNISSSFVIWWDVQRITLQVRTVNRIVHSSKFLFNHFYTLKNNISWELKKAGATHVTSYFMNLSPVFYIDAKGFLLRWSP
jgi:hypothetical protein